MNLETLQEKARKKLVGVHPPIAEKALELISRAFSEGIYIIITQGLRTIEEQNALYAQGRTKPGPKVTNAKGGTSYHNFGLAFDFAILEFSGAINWTVDKRWKRVGVIGESLGLEWGGRWTSFVDIPHFQITYGLSTADLRNGKKPPEVVSAAFEKGKEESWMAEKFEVSNKTLQNSVVTVLARFEQKDPALSKEWREKFAKGELTNGDAIGILYHGVFNGWITGIQK